MNAFEAYNTVREREAEAQNLYNRTTNEIPMTREEAGVEALFIASVNPLAPGDLFNNNPTTFARYCAGQVRSMRFSGFHLTAMDVENAGMLADPAEFRERLHDTF